MVKQAFDGTWKAIAMGNSQHFDTLEEAEAWVAEMQSKKGNGLRGLREMGFSFGRAPSRPGGNWGNGTESSYR